MQRTERPNIPELEPSFYGFGDADQETVFDTSNTFFGKDRMSLRELVNALRETYCGTLGAEYMYTTDMTQKRWWQQKLESIRSKPTFSAEKKKHILDRLTAAEGLERYLHTKYVGQKRFSLEGGESFIAAMDELIHMAGIKGVQEVVIGMAHRGRLNVLVNTMGKLPCRFVCRVRPHRPRRPACRRREIPPRLQLGRVHPWRSCSPVFGVQPIAFGNRQPRGGRLGALTHGPPWRPQRQPSVACVGAW